MQQRYACSGWPRTILDLFEVSSSGVEELELHDLFVCAKALQDYERLQAASVASWVGVNYRSQYRGPPTVLEFMIMKKELPFHRQTHIYVLMEVLYVHYGIAP